MYGIIFYVKDAEGKMIENEQGFEVIEGKEAEFKAANEAFGEKTVEIPVSPITIAMLEGVKLSAEEIEALGGLLISEITPPSDHLKLAK
jgi:hypothetical protein